MTLSVTINAHNYNTDDYNASSNPYGLGAGGWRLLVAGFVADIAADVAVALQMSATDSLAIAGSGTKTFTPAVLRAVPVGAYCYALHDASNWMYGQVTTVSATQVTITVSASAGSGTYATWTLQPTSPPATVSTGPSYLADGGSTQTTGFTAVANTRYIADTTSAAFTVTLPAAPSVKDKVEIAYGGVNALTLNPNGLKINGSTANLAIGDEQTIVLTYHSAARGWV